MIRRLIDASLATPRALWGLVLDCALGEAEPIPARNFAPAFLDEDWDGVTVHEDEDELGYSTVPADFRRLPMRRAGDYLSTPCQCRVRCDDHAEDDDLPTAICKGLPE